MPLWFRVVRLWIPLAVAITAAIGFTYLATQQSYRNGLDHPQTQIALDAAARIGAGASPERVVPSSVVDIDSSLATFVIAYDSDNRPVAWSGTLGGKPPVAPPGVLDAARARSPHKVTWQPKPGVRIASVSAASKDGVVVLAGRNMREVEQSIDELGKLALIAWFATVLGLLAVVVGVEVVGRRWGVDGATPQDAGSLP